MSKSRNQSQLQLIAANGRDKVTVSVEVETQAETDPKDAADRRYLKKLHDEKVSDMVDRLHQALSGDFHVQQITIKHPDRPGRK